MREPTPIEQALLDHLPTGVALDQRTLIARVEAQTNAVPSLILGRLRRLVDEGRVMRHEISGGVTTLIMRTGRA